MAYEVLRNARGDASLPVPVKNDGSLYPFSMLYSGDTLVAFADTPEDLLDVLSPGYLALESDQERLVARITVAINAQTSLQAEFVAGASEEDLGALQEWERKVLLGSRVQQPSGFGSDGEGDPEGLGDVWRSPVPLVLVESGYAPYTGVDRPISGIADVEDSPNLVWLNPVDEWDFLVSLTNAGYVTVSSAIDL